MAKKILVSYDFNKNEIQNARLQNLATAPGSPVAGQVYYDTASSDAKLWNGTAWISWDPAKAAAGSILNTALATNPLARGNHTGTQVASTISDFDTAVRVSKLNQMGTPTADVAFGGFKLTGVANPAAGTDAANKQYVDDTVAGLSWKDEVRIATTANGVLATAFANGQTVDGVLLVTNDRILIKDQTTQTENGIYTVQASGAPVRVLDANTAPELQGAAVFVSNGTTNGGTRWVNNNTGTITIGSTNISFVGFGGGASYTNGDGLNLAATTFSVKPVSGGNIIVGPAGVDVDVTKVVRKYATLVGNGSLTSITVTHSLNTQDITVSVRDASTNDFVECDVQANAVNTCVLSFAVAPTSNQYRVVVHG